MRLTGREFHSLMRDGKNKSQSKKSKKPASMPSGLAADAVEIWCCWDFHKLVYNAVHHSSFGVLSMCLEFQPSHARIQKFLSEGVQL